MKLDSATKGKIAEHFMYSLLLKNGLKVCVVLVDNEGMDCVILGKKTYYPIQIKSRVEFEGNTITVYDFYENMFIIAVNIITKEFWVIPKDVYQRLSRKKHHKKGYFYYRLNIKTKRKQLEKYKGNKGLKLLRKIVK